jgi:hypothetical protein
MVAAWLSQRLSQKSRVVRGAKTSRLSTRLFRAAKVGNICSEWDGDCDEEGTEKLVRCSSRFKPMTAVILEFIKLNKDLAQVQELLT